MKNDLLNSIFFELNDFSYRDLLDDCYPWESIAKLSSYIQKLFLDKKVIPNYKNKSNVFIGEGTVVHPSVEIVGPVIIGSDCDIRHAAYIRENCLIGDNVIVGHATEVKNSIIFNKSVVNHFCYIGDSIIGNKVNIAAGAKLANLRFDKKNISIKTEEGRIDTGLRKFSAAVGDNSEVGVNSVLNPGTLLGKNSVVYPLKSVTGYYKNNSRIK